MKSSGEDDWLGVDVGGANIKLFAPGVGAVSRPFELWKRPAELASALRELLASAPASLGVAATMTGELADCYRTKAEGVATICDALAEAAGARELKVYTTRGRFVDGEQAPACWREVAAANWHAIASAAAQRFTGQAGVLVDVGSTTTDVIPFSRGRVVAQGATDRERLQTGELLYFGLGRTPICAVVDSLPYRGGMCPVAAEWFATTLDVALLLGTPTADCPTADGRPATREYARERMARMLCLDASEFTLEDARLAAQEVLQGIVQRTQDAVQAALSRMDEEDEPVIVVSGSGANGLAEPLQAVTVGSKVVRLADSIGEAASACAAAEAVAYLAAREPSA
ncbi:MAG: hypothetical protein KDA37_06750 [Planctomycetales bacterium]|nr:hypothetical protein [Planctomycetales bacterium]